MSPLPHACVDKKQFKIIGLTFSNAVVKYNIPEAVEIHLFELHSSSES